MCWALGCILALLCVLPAGAAPLGPRGAAGELAPVAAAGHYAGAKGKHRKKGKKRKRGKTERGRRPGARLVSMVGGNRPTPRPTPTPTPPSPAPSGGGPATPPPPPAGGSSNPQPAARPLWQGGFETGNVSQWKQLNGNLAKKDRYFGLVTAPTAEGRYAFRSTVDAGAVVPGEAGQRSMVLLFPSNNASQNTTGAYEGSERWYRTKMYFPADFHPSPKTAWNWLVQWHNWPDGACCSNLAIAVDAERGAEKLSLRVMGGGDQAHPVENNDIITEKNPTGRLEWFVGDPVLKRNHWYDSVVHVKWSVDHSKGFVEWWLDGRRIVSKAMPTLYWYADNNRNFAGATPGPGQAYYMEGYYRPAQLPDGSTDTSSASVFFDGAQIGKTADSVGN